MQPAHSSVPHTFLYHLSTLLVDLVQHQYDRCSCTIRKRRRTNSYIRAFCVCFSMAAQAAAAQAEAAVALKYKYNETETENVHWASRDAFSVYRNVAVAYVVHNNDDKMKVGVVTRPGRLRERLKEIATSGFGDEMKLQALFFVHRMFAFKREAPHKYGVEDALKIAANNSNFWDSTPNTQEYFQLQQGKRLVNALTSVIKDAAHDMYEQQRISTFQTSTQAFNYFAVLWAQNGSCRFKPSNTLYINLHLTQDCMPTYAEGDHTITIQAKQQAPQPASALPAPSAQTLSRARGAATSTKFQSGDRVRWKQDGSLGTVESTQESGSVNVVNDDGKRWGGQENLLELYVPGPLLAWRTGA